MASPETPPERARELQLDAAALHKRVAELAKSLGDLQMVQRAEQRAERARARARSALRRSS